MTLFIHTQDENINKRRIISIFIKPGSKTGSEIIYPKEGDQNSVHIPTDIIFNTDDKPHEQFIRENNSLVTEADIIIITDIVCPKKLFLKKVCRY